MSIKEDKVKRIEDETINEQNDRVLRAIGAGSGSAFGVIHRRIDGGRDKSMRVIDRTLQRLKRAGRIAYIDRVWRVV